MKRLTPPNSKSVRAFTLIEILVVLLIISIVTSVAILQFGGISNRQLKAFATELSQNIMLAQEEALLRPGIIGLSIEEQRYYFSIYTSSLDKKKQVWVRLQDPLFANHDIPAGLSVYFASSPDDESTKQTPQIVIAPNGDLQTFTLYISRTNSKARYAIIGEEDGSVQLKSLS